MELPAFMGSKVTSSLSNKVVGVLNVGRMPLSGLLNSSVAWLGNLGLIGVDLICNKTIWISILVSRFL